MAAMHRPTVFLVTGYARSGKDTLADALVQRIPGCVKIAFADSLKDAGNRFFTALGIEDVNLRSTYDKIKHRDLLVAMGKAARSIDPDVFARCAADRARYNVLAGRCVVISDWRYLNEYTAIQRICYPARIVTISLTRSGGVPANEEEQESIRDIDAAVTYDYDRHFADRDIQGIDDFSHELANDTPIVRSA